MGRNVPIIRRRDLDTADRVDANQWRQQARLPGAVQWKSQRGCSQNGHIFEAKLQVLGLDGVVFFIHLKAGRFEHPFGQPAGAWQARAGGVGRIANDGTLLIDELNVRSLAMAATFEQGVVSLQKMALKGVRLQDQGTALESIAFSIDLDIAGGFQGVLRLIVLNALRLHSQALLAQQSIAFDDHVQVGTGIDALARNKQG